MASSPPASGHAIAWISSTMITVSTTPAMMVPLKEFSSASIRGFLPSNVVTPTALRPYVAVYALIGPDQTRDLGEELCAERNSGGLTPLEIRHAAVRHGLDAFAEILGAAQPVLLDQLALGGRVDRVGEAAPQRLAGRDDGERRRLRDLEGQRLGGAAHLGLRHQQIGEADAHRLAAGNAPAGVEQERRLLDADQARQGHCQPEPGVKAEPVEIGAEPGLVAGHPEIGHQRQAEPAADRGPVNRTDDRLAGAEQPARLLVEVPAGAAARRFLHRAGIHPLGEIGAGAKRTPFGGEHDRPAGIVGVEPLERLADLGDQLAVEEIMRRPAQLNRCDKPVEGHADILEPAVIAHLCCSLTISASTTVRPWPAGWTMTGLRSISATASAWSAAKRDSAAISSASAARSAGGAPRTPSSTAAPFSSAIRSSASSRPSGTGAKATSFSTSTWMPPSPTISIGPKSASRVTPRMISVPRRAMAWTSTPSIRAPGFAAAARASVLCRMSGDCTLSATAPPILAAAATASSSLAANSSGGSGTP